MTAELIFTPAEAASLALQALDDLKAHKGVGIKTGIADLDRVMLPLRPAELCVVMGYTSNYKSGFMNWMLKAAVEQCLSADVVIKVTWEDSVEEDTLKWLASVTKIPMSEMLKGVEVDKGKIQEAYKKRIDTPLWEIGHSSLKSYAEGRTRPRLTMGEVTKAVEFICEGINNEKHKPRLIVLDYLQRIRPDKDDGATKREQMMEAVNKSKDLAVQMGCPVVLGVQASRSVLGRENKLPQLEDGLETSNIEQSSDKVLSLWYPIKTEDVGKKLDEYNVTVSQNLLICGLLKQKMGIAPVTFPLFIDPAINVVGSMQREAKK